MEQYSTKSSVCCKIKLQFDYCIKVRALIFLMNHIWHKHCKTITEIFMSGGVAMKTALLGAAAILALSSATAQAGILYFDFNRNQVSSAANSSVFLFGTTGQTATVSNLAGFSQNIVFGVDGFFNLPIANTYQQSGTGIRNTGFQVVSPDPIAGYFVNRAPFTTDMTYLLDSAALSTEYVVASQGQGFGEGSQVAIHATENNTAVTFTPKGGAAINVVLQAGETYKYAGGSTDLTGSLVSADKKVAVFGGHECAQTPPGITACDTLLEQMIPTDKLSKTYVLAATKAASISATGGDIVRIIATVNGTQVTVDGVVVATLNKGDVYQYSLPANSGSIVSATQPVMVAQYLVGGQGTNTDPAMSLVPGSDEWLDEYRLSTPSGAQSFIENYASIAIETADLASLLLNGLAVNTAGCTVIGSSIFSRCNIDLPLGLFDLTADSPFEVMLGGGSSADSYLTYGGATFAPGISPPPPPVDPPLETPEPATIALLAAGLGGIEALRRRRKSRQK
ncbi:MAG: PEP-CTERM sorting domain-containing protein [Rhizobiales bacterium]|nr:PEP-CTERM sorting domain-containing protein [Hyphomicrobiales bacterium]